MTDRELLEKAAKAAGLLVTGIYDVSGMGETIFVEQAAWNPLTDDGAALRLAVKLRMDIRQWYDWVEADPFSDGSGPQEDYVDDPYAATRRAIVRAAAEIGKTMP